MNSYLHTKMHTEAHNPKDKHNHTKNHSHTLSSVFIQTENQAYIHFQRQTSPHSNK